MQVLAAVVVVFHGAEVAQVRCRDGAWANSVEPRDSLGGSEAVAADQPGRDERAGAALTVAELHGDAALDSTEGEESVHNRVERGPVVAEGEVDVAKASLLQSFHVTGQSAVKENHAGNAVEFEGGDEMFEGEHNGSGVCRSGPLARTNLSGAGAVKGYEL